MKWLSLKKFVVLIFLLHYAAHGKDLLEDIQTSDDNPSELNVFFEDVMKYKPAFQIIRKAADKVETKRGRRNDRSDIDEYIYDYAEPSDSKYTNQKQRFLDNPYKMKNSRNDEQFTRPFKGNRPFNDIYPHIYKERPIHRYSEKISSSFDEDEILNKKYSEKRNRDYLTDQKDIDLLFDQSRFRRELDKSVEVQSRGTNGNVQVNGEKIVMINSDSNHIQPRFQANEGLFSIFDGIGTTTEHGQSTPSNFNQKNGFDLLFTPNLLSTTEDAEMVTSQEKKSVHVLNKKEDLDTTESNGVTKIKKRSIKMDIKAFTLDDDIAEQSSTISLLEKSNQLPSGLIHTDDSKISKFNFNKHNLLQPDRYTQDLFYSPLKPQSYFRELSPEYLKYSKEFSDEYSKKDDQFFQSNRLKTRNLKSVFEFLKNDTKNYHENKTLKSKSTYNDTQYWLNNETKKSLPYLKSTKTYQQMKSSGQRISFFSTVKPNTEMVSNDENNVVANTLKKPEKNIGLNGFKTSTLSSLERKYKLKKINVKNMTKSKQQPYNKIYKRSQELIRRKKSKNKINTHCSEHALPVSKYWSSLKPFCNPCYYNVKSNLIYKKDNLSTSNNISKFNRFPLRKLLTKHKGRLLRKSRPKRGLFDGEQSSDSMETLSESNEYLSKRTESDYNEEPDLSEGTNFKTHIKEKQYSKKAPLGKNFEDSYEYEDAKESKSNDLNNKLTEESEIFRRQSKKCPKKKLKHKNLTNNCQSPSFKDRLSKLKNKLFSSQNNDNEILESDSNLNDEFNKDFFNKAANTNPHFENDDKSLEENGSDNQGNDDTFEHQSTRRSCATCHFPCDFSRPAASCDLYDCCPCDINCPRPCPEPYFGIYPTPQISPCPPNCLPSCPCSCDPCEIPSYPCTSCDSCPSTCSYPCCPPPTEPCPLFSRCKMSDFVQDNIEQKRMERSKCCGPDSCLKSCCPHVIYVPPIENPCSPPVLPELMPLPCASHYPFPCPHRCNLPCPYPNEPYLRNKRFDFQSESNLPRFKENEEQRRFDMNNNQYNNEQQMPFYPAFPLKKVNFGNFEKIYQNRELKKLSNFKIPESKNEEFPEYNKNNNLKREKIGRQNIPFFSSYYLNNFYPNQFALQNPPVDSNNEEQYKRCILEKCDALCGSGPCSLFGSCKSCSPCEFPCSTCDLPCSSCDPCVPYDPCIPCDPCGSCDPCCPINPCSPCMPYGCSDFPCEQPCACLKKSLQSNIKRKKRSSFCCRSSDDSTSLPNNRDKKRSLNLPCSPCCPYWPFIQCLPSNCSDSYNPYRLSECFSSLPCNSCNKEMNFKNNENNEFLKKYFTGTVRPSKLCNNKKNINLDAYFREKNSFNNFSPLYSYDSPLKELVYQSIPEFAHYKKRKIPSKKSSQSYECASGPCGSSPCPFPCFREGQVEDVSQTHNRQKRNLTFSCKLCTHPVPCENLFKVLCPCGPCLKEIVLNNQDQDGKNQEHSNKTCLIMSCPCYCTLPKEKKTKTNLQPKRSNNFFTKREPNLKNIPNPINVDLCPYPLPCPFPYPSKYLGTLKNAKNIVHHCNDKRYLFKSCPFFSDFYSTGNFYNSFTPCREAYSCEPCSVPPCHFPCPPLCYPILAQCPFPCDTYPTKNIENLGDNKVSERRRSYNNDNSKIQPSPFRNLDTVTENAKKLYEEMLGNIDKSGNIQTETNPNLLKNDLAFNSDLYDTEYSVVSDSPLVNKEILDENSLNSRRPTYLNNRKRRKDIQYFQLRDLKLNSNNENNDDSEKKSQTCECPKMLLFPWPISLPCKYKDSFLNTGTNIEPFSCKKYKRCLKKMGNKRSCLSSDTSAKRCKKNISKRNIEQYSGSPFPYIPPSCPWPYNSANHLLACSAPHLEKLNNRNFKVNCKEHAKDAGNEMLQNKKYNNMKLGNGLNINKLFLKQIPSSNKDTQGLYFLVNPQSNYKSSKQSFNWFFHNRKLKDKRKRNMDTNSDTQNEQSCCPPFPVYEPLPIPIPVPTPISCPYSCELPVPCPYSCQIPVPSPDSCEIPVPCPNSCDIQVSCPISVLTKCPHPPIGCSSNSTENSNIKRCIFSSQKKDPSCDPLWLVHSTCPYPHCPCSYPWNPCPSPCPYPCPYSSQLSFRKEKDMYANGNSNKYKKRFCTYPVPDVKKKPNCPFPSPEPCTNAFSDPVLISIPYPCLPYLNLMKKCLIQNEESTSTTKRNSYSSCPDTATIPVPYPCPYPCPYFCPPIPLFSEGDNNNEDNTNDENMECNPYKRSNTHFSEAPSNPIMFCPCIYYKGASPCPCKFYLSCNDSKDSDLNSNKKENEGKNAKNQNCNRKKRTAKCGSSNVSCKIIGPFTCINEPEDNFKENTQTKNTKSFTSNQDFNFEFPYYRIKQCVYPICFVFLNTLSKNDSDCSDMQKKKMKRFEAFLNTDNNLKGAPCPCESLPSSCPFLCIPECPTCSYPCPLSCNPCCLCIQMEKSMKINNNTNNSPQNDEPDKNPQTFNKREDQYFSDFIGNTNNQNFVEPEGIKSTVNLEQDDDEVCCPDPCPCPCPDPCPEMGVCCPSPKTEPIPNINSNKNHFSSRNTFGYLNSMSAGPQYYQLPFYSKDNNQNLMFTPSPLELMSRYSLESDIQDDVSNKRAIKFENSEGKKETRFMRKIHGLPKKQKNKKIPQNYNLDTIENDIVVETDDSPSNKPHKILKREMVDNLDENEINTEKSCNDEDLKPEDFLLVKKKSCSELQDIQFAREIVDSVISKVNKNGNLRVKIGNSLNRKRIYENENLMQHHAHMCTFEERAEYAEAKNLLHSVTCVLNKLVRKQISEKLCTRLPAYLLAFLKRIVRPPRQQISDHHDNAYHEDTFLFRTVNTEIPLDPQTKAQLQNILQRLIYRYNSLDEESKKRAAPVKYYIQNHLNLLQSMGPYYAKEMMKRNLDSLKPTISSLESHIDDALENLEELEQENKNEDKRQVSGQYKKLDDAADEVRFKRNNDEKIGEAFGNKKIKGTDKESLDMDQVAFDSPLVFRNV